MNMYLEELCKKTYAYWIDFFRNNLGDNLRYHSVQHTVNVFQSCIEIGKAEGVSTDDLHMLQLAAIFHDAGFLNNPLDHEIESCKIAEGYLAQNHLPLTDRQKICEMILATKIPQHPTSKLGEILCDADLAYLGTTQYEENASHLRQELSLHGKNFTDEQWIQIQISFLEQHSFFTRYATEKFTPNKSKHLQRLKSQIGSGGHSPTA